jgi:HYR domain
VLLLAPQTTAYTATAVGAPHGSYSISVSSLDPSFVDAAAVTDQVQSGQLDASGRATLAFTPQVAQIPRITRHRMIVVRSAGRDGRRVHYRAPRARDGQGRKVHVVCLPASGHRFRIGTTIVRCTARDPLGPVAHSQFRIVVKRHQGLTARHAPREARFGESRQERRRLDPSRLTGTTTSRIASS